MLGPASPRRGASRLPCHLGGQRSFLPFLTAALVGIVGIVGSGASGGSAFAGGSTPNADGARSARAQSTPAPASGWNWSARVGAALFTQARSLALPHNVQPSLHVAADIELIHRLQFGAGASAIATSDPNYGVWAGYLRGRSVLYRSATLQWGTTLGLGAGYNPPIVHADLKADLPVVPYAMLATDIGFRLGADAWIGAELAVEQLSVVHLGATLRWH